MDNYDGSESVLYPHGQNGLRAEAIAKNCLIVDNQTIVCNNFTTIEGIKSRLTRVRTKKKVTFVLIRRGSMLLGEFCYEIS